MTSSDDVHMTKKAGDDDVNLVLECIGDALLRVDARWMITYVNAQAEQIYKIKREALIGRNMWAVFAEARGTVFEKAFRDAMTTRQSAIVEGFYKPLNESWFEVNIFPLTDGGLAFYFRDISERKRMAAILSGQKRAMELALSGAPLEDILEMLTETVEGYAGNAVIASVMLLDDKDARLHIGAGRRLPDDYRKAIDGMETGPCVASCGTAAHMAQATMVQDIATDPLWVNFRDVAVAQGLRACWSTPIFSSHGSILGTFALYYTEARTPAPNDMKTAEAFAQTAAVVIERHNDQRDRLAAEIALREANARMDRDRRLYESIMSATPDFVYVFDLSYRVVYANKALTDMWGKSWENTVGKTFLELGYEPWHADMHSREIDEVARTKAPIRGTVPFNGTLGRRMYEYIFVPVFGENGEVEAVAGTTRDVTETLEAEHTLRESESRFRFLTELEQAARGVSDPGEIMEIATRMTAEQLNASRCAYADMESDGDHFTIRADYVADGSFSTAGYYSLDLFGSKAVTCLTQGQTLVVRNVDHEMTAADGGDTFKAIGIRAIVTCPLVKEGRLHAMMAVHQNAPRNWTEEEIRLMEMVAERSWSYIERVRQEAMLRDADRKKDEFLATLAHELRNPLAPLRNALHVIQSPSAAPEMVKESRALMDRQLRQMVRLVDDLMDVSRISHGKIALKPESLSLSDVIQSAIETARPLIDEKSHRLEVHLPAQPLRVRGDRVRLAQVFANLLNNAAKYTDPGGKITVTVAPAGKTVNVSIGDNGIGIEPGKRAQIFDLFTQVDNSMERAHGGLGIGLTLVKNLVERHGGDIRVEGGAEGQGSTFTVNLPLETGAAENTVAPAPAAAEEDAPAPQPNKLKVMVVDDNKDSADTIGWALEMFGYDIKVMTDSPASIAAARDYKPDVVLLDIGMPGMNGYEICAAMRADPATKNAIFIAQTGWGQDSHRESSKQAGFHHHLVKPIDLKALAALLGEITTQAPGH